MSRARSVSELGNQTLNLSVTEGALKVGTGITFESTGETQFSGIITATQFVGDGSGLTGVTGCWIWCCSSRGRFQCRNSCNNKFCRNCRNCDNFWWCCDC